MATGLSAETSKLTDGSPKIFSGSSSGRLSNTSAPPSSSRWS